MSPTGSRNDDDLDGKQARATLCLAARVLARLGLVQGHGHLSARLGRPGPDGRILSTPRGAPSLARPEDLIVFTPGSWQQHRDRMPVEAALHLAVYRARPDVGAIVRVHGPKLDVVSTRLAELPIAHGRGAHLRASPKVLADPSPIATEVLAEQAVRVLGAGQAAFLRGNGAFVVGIDVPDAVANASYLLECVAIRIAGGLTEAPRPFTEAELQLRGTGMKIDSGRRTWDFLLADLNPSGDRQAHEKDAAWPRSSHG